MNRAFQLYEIPNVTDQMLKILETGERLGEEATSIPLITQGQSGVTTPDTFGAAQLQNNNANQLLRSIGYAFDDNITEPQVRQYYEWLLLDPDVPDEEKGEFTINAHGSIALVERAIQDQTLWQMGALVTKGTCASGTTTLAKIGATDFYAVAQGALVKIAAGTNMPALTGINITANYYNVVCFYVNAAGTASVAAGTQATTLAGVVFPQPPYGQALVGFLIITYASNFGVRRGRAVAADSTHTRTWSP